MASSQLRLSLNSGVDIPTKTSFRARLLAARRTVSAEVRAREADALIEALLAASNDLFRPGDTVCAYVPVGTEPGSLALLDALVAAGTRVLLPVAITDSATSAGALPGTPLPLQWADYEPGDLAAAGFGLLEPTGPRLAAETIAAAALLIVPALAVDQRGVRLGRGAGFYDRSLPLRDVNARMVAIVRDEELVAELPADEHDVAMTHALTPGRGLVAF
jgi:5-formyltetrahydrofolate cyclo-ligase